LPSYSAASTALLGKAFGGKVALPCVSTFFRALLSSRTSRRERLAHDELDAPVRCRLQVSQAVLAADVTNDAAVDWLLLRDLNIGNGRGCVCV
jgi:hypothetical protein